MFLRGTSTDFLTVVILRLPTDVGVPNQILPGT